MTAGTVKPRGEVPVWDGIWVKTTVRVAAAHGHLGYMCQDKQS